MTRVLDVYLCDIFAGKLHQDNSGRLSFNYNSDYLKEAHLPLSISMPLQPQTYHEPVSQAFFSGLLPEASLRERIADSLKISAGNTFKLLEVIGGDCAGAVSLYPEGERPEKPNDDFRLLSDLELIEVVNDIRQYPFLIDRKNIRLSLAGAQDKLPVLLVKDDIAIPQKIPSSHILKTPIIRFENDIFDSVQNEFFCMQLAKAVHINVPETKIKWCEKVPLLLISRYDREIEWEKLISYCFKHTTYNNYVRRLHQEDFCQALGIVPQKKYQNEGGPSIIQCLNLVETFSARPGIDRLELIRRIIFNYLIGNADAHAKNFSFLYRGGKRILAPAYDLLSTAIYPKINQKMAMKIGSQYEPYRVYWRHWQSLVENTAIAHKILATDLQDLAKNLPELADQLRQDMEQQGVFSPAFQKIKDVIHKRSKHILAYNFSEV